MALEAKEVETEDELVPMSRVMCVEVSRLPVCASTRGCTRVGMPRDGEQSGSEGGRAPKAWRSISILPYTAILGAIRDGWRVRSFLVRVLYSSWVRLFSFGSTADKRSLVDTVYDYLHTLGLVSQDSAWLTSHVYSPAPCEVSPTALYIPFDYLHCYQTNRVPAFRLA